MIDIFVRSLLGPWGQRLLDAYLEHSLWINGLILLYFGTLVISRRNYRRSLAAIIDAIEKRYGQTTGKASARELKTRLAQDGVPWEAGLQGSAWPLIAGPHSFLPRLKSQQTMQKLFPPDDVVAFITAKTAPGTSKTDRAK